MMTTAVRYYSKGGNTKKLADAIAEVCGVEKPRTHVALTEKADILFLGASVYAYGISEEVKKFIVDLDPEKVGKIVVFSTSALAERAFPEVEKAIKDSGMEVDSRNFYCRGSFLMLHKGRPNADDLESAKSFAKNIIG